MSEPTLIKVGEILNGRAQTFRFEEGGILYRIATPLDDSVLRSLLRENPMDSWVVMTLEREPHYFDGEGLMGFDFTILGERTKSGTSSTVGMGSWGIKPVHVNGDQTNLGYLGQLRIRDTFRHRIRVLKHCHQAVKIFTDGANPDWNFTSIVSGNKVALRILNANLAGMPVYMQQGHYATLAMSTAKGKAENYRADISSARIEDVADLVRFYNEQSRKWQFSPCLSERWLTSLDSKRGLSLEDFLVFRRNNKFSGCLAVWDQRAFKQVVAQNYRFPINLLRLPYNLYARLVGRITLPPAGLQLQQVYLAFLAFDELSEQEILAILGHGLVRAKAKGADVALLGLSELNSLALKVCRYFKPTVYRSEIETVSWSGEELPELDGRPVQPEAALL